MQTRQHISAITCRIRAGLAAVSVGYVLLIAITSMAGTYGAQLYVSRAWLPAGYRVSERVISANVIFADLARALTTSLPGRVILGALLLLWLFVALVMTTMYLLDRFAETKSGEIRQTFVIYSGGRPPSNVLKFRREK
jgi:beta-lactamase regulating signal transducer with metallopeptidase domain